MHTSGVAVSECAVTQGTLCFVLRRYKYIVCSFDARISDELERVRVEAVVVGKRSYHKVLLDGWKKKYWRLSVLCSRSEQTF